MNLEIEVPGLKIKLEYAEKKHIDRTISAVMHYVQGGKFNDVFDVAQAYVKKEKVRPVNFVPEVDGVKDYGNGKIAYKCSYKCDCGHKGVRYIVGDEEYVHCHKCDEKLSVSPATLNDAHDDEFNYFVAY